ncbi:tubulin-folding cofactor C [Vigna radiata var. radiata]|uniref:Tubulin-folding cofactor C n=1 Tax=Vigna radiata var. radiata TaxID=3916 RepID=A0A1S3UNE4_VIGRR|nr:tubulin-folding cofactor C [Vigna radiata var. radiata]
MEDETEKQKKHLAMVERLSKRPQSRSTNPESSTESTSSVLSHFSQLKTSIEFQLQQSQSLSSDPPNLKLHFQNISESISDLEKLVAQNSYLLPSYDVRTSLKTVSDLRQSLQNLTNQLIPKTRFSFKNKPTKKDPKDTAIPQPKQPPQSSIPDTRLAARESPGFRNKVGEVLVAEFRGSEVGEFAVSDLDSCEVRIIGSVRALFVHRLKNCRVYVGPVTGSVLIEEAEGCVFVMASHQIRIHSARKSDFYLRVRSKPIIEDSNGVRFAPYCLSYPGIEEDLRGAGLDTETGNWENVDDFRWLRAVQSPNWSVLPESERVGIVDVSNLKNGDEEI